MSEDGRTDPIVLSLDGGHAYSVLGRSTVALVLRGLMQLNHADNQPH